MPTAPRSTTATAHARLRCLAAAGLAGHHDRIRASQRLRQLLPQTSHGQARALRLHGSTLRAASPARPEQM
jgi:hypothetical protein